MGKCVSDIARCMKQGLIHWRIRQLSNRDWRKRFTTIYSHCPEYKNAVDRDIEQAHLEMWSPLRKDVHLDTLRVCHGISDRADPHIVPEEVYVSEVEPKLNDRAICEFLAYKTAYNRWFDDGIFPAVWIHNSDGVLYDEHYHRIQLSDAIKLCETLTYPVVMKPNIDSFGGADVFFVENRERLIELLRTKQDFVVQERITPHPYFEKFSPVGLNTLRVCLYRSVRTNQWHVLNIALRMGKGGSLDNETAGGIVCYINEDGRLGSYAVDKYGVKYTSHPDSQILFAEQTVIPEFESMRPFVTDLAQKLFLTRLASLDIALDADKQWRAIEVNLFRQTIRFSQYAGHPFFGKFTNEVIDYCRTKKRS